MIKKLKIAVVVDQLLPGGVQKCAIEEVKCFNKLGHSAKLLILMRKGFERKFANLVKDTPYEFLSDRYPKIFRKSFKLPFFTFLSTLHLFSPMLAPLKVKEEEFDIIISHGTTTSLTTWSLSNFRKIPYLAIVHDPMVYILDKIYAETNLKYFFPILKPISAYLEANFIKSAQNCLVDSGVHAKYLQKKYGVNPKILYLGTKPPKKIPKKRGSVILAFGRWDKGKNPKILLNLINSLPKTKMIMAGNWSKLEDLAEFKKLIKTTKLQKRVKLIPNYSEKQLAEITAQGRVWIHPHFEAFSLSALEAASYGLPIIIPAKSGVTEIFKNNIHGFFPRRITVKGLKKIIMPLLSNERLAYKMGKEAAKIAKLHTYKLRAIKLLVLIGEVLKNQPVEIVALETGHIAGSLVAGGDKLLEEMIKRTKKTFGLTVIVPKVGIGHWQESKLDIKLKILPANPFEKYTGPFGVFANYFSRIWQSFFILRKIAKDPNKKIIIYSSTNIWPDVFPAFLIKITQAKVIWLARIHHLSPPPRKRLGRFWVNLGSYFLQKISLFAIRTKADLILVLNSNLKKDLEKIGFPSGKMITLGGGVDFKVISETKPLPKKQFDGVFLGRFHPAKGIFDLAPIWQQVVKEKPDAKIAIIGTGPPENVRDLKKQINDYNLKKKMDLLGFIPQGKVWRVLKSSKVFLFTDREAGFGLATAEAMAAGCPVVGWDIGILGSVFKSGFIKIKLENIDLFAQETVKILKNKALHQKLSYQASQEAFKFDWNITSKNFIKLVNEIGK